MSNQSIVKIKNIKLENVSAVYSGQAGKCFCGCSGKYTYSSEHRVAASSNRGYEVTDDEVNDKVVRMMVNKMNKNLASAELGKDYVYVEVGNRAYCAYFRTKMKIKK